VNRTDPSDVEQPETALTLSTLLADYPVTHALRTGAVASPVVDFDFSPIKPSNKGFKPMVREGAFDFGELAIVTFLQAKEHGKPLVLLPATISGRFQHHCIAYNIERGEITPEGLNGKRIGVRAYTQTTGMWVRGILQNQYGVDLDSIEWLTFEDAHVAEYSNPPNVVIAPPDKTLKDMLLDGELDAAMLGDEMPDDPRLRTVIPDPKAAAKAWYAETGAISVNHLAVMRAELVRDRPDVAREVFRLLKASKAAANLSEPVDMRPYGLAALRPSLELAIRYSLQQGLLRRELSPEELFDETTLALE
jgi:4,5-dihydroxyphthalate decarboxylase